MEKPFDIDNIKIRRESKSGDFSVNERIKEDFLDSFARGDNKLVIKIESLIMKRDVLNVIAPHLEGKTHEITKELYDHVGLYRLDISCKESDGSLIEYTFQRKSMRTGEELEPAIHSARFEDDIPVGDGPLQHYFNQA